MKATPYPPKKRAIRSLLVAPLLPVGIVFVLDATDRTLQFGPLAILGAALLSFYMLVIVELVAVTLGGLVLALLWKRVPFNVLICALAGGLVVSLPFLVWNLLFSIDGSLNYDAWVDGRATVVDGVKTSYGRWQDFQFLLQIFALGVVGGGFFWWLCRPTRPAERLTE